MMEDPPPGITDAQVIGLQVTIVTSLAGLIGRIITPALIDEITRRMIARATIVDELLECETGLYD